jgi:hypothetical protein
MTNDETNPNDEIRNPALPFGLRHSFVIRHSCFVILLSHPFRHFDAEKIETALQNSPGEIAQY